MSVAAVKRTAPFPPPHDTVNMNRGYVKMFNEAKGFGFIVADQSREQYFFNLSGSIDEVREGDKVEFDLKQGTKGLNAVNIKLV